MKRPPFRRRRVSRSELVDFVRLVRRQADPDLRELPLFSVLDDLLVVSTALAIRLGIEPAGRPEPPESAITTGQLPEEAA